MDRKQSEEIVKAELDRYYEITLPRVIDQHQSPAEVLLSVGNYLLARVVALRNTSVKEDVQKAAEKGFSG